MPLMLRSGGYTGDDARVTGNDDVGGVVVTDDLSQQIERQRRPSLPGSLACGHDRISSSSLKESFQEHGRRFSVNLIRRRQRWNRLYLQPSTNL